LLSAVAIGMSITVSGAQTSDSASPTAEITMMVAGLGNEVFVPRDAEGAGGYGVFLHASLLDTDADGQLIGGVAEDWSMSEDGLTWTFKIREGIKFHDGTDLTAEDVAYTLQHTFGPEAAAESLISSTAAIAENTQSIEQTDANTVLVVHKTPMPFFASLIASRENEEGAIIPKAYFEEVGAEGYNRAPIGAGPYKITDYKPGVSIRFERFDDYYNPERAGTVRVINYVVVPELATRMVALQSGEADVVQASLQSIPAIEEAGGTVALAPQSSYIWFMLPGCWDPELWCHDKRVRQALDLAIDKQAIMTSLFGELWTPHGWAFVSSISLGYSPELDPTPFDPEAAKVLLAEAGFPNGEGIPPITINAVSGDAIAALPDFAQLVGDMWEKNLGLTTEVRTGDAGTLRDQWRGRELDGQIFIRSNEGRFDGADITISLYGNPESLNRHHQDPELWDLVAETSKVIDPEERHAAYNALYIRLKEETYEIGTGSIAQVWGLGPRIAGWQPWSLMLKPSALWTLQVKE
jgi:peptide/nickel transport system substrate-binding protein